MSAPRHLTTEGKEALRKTIRGLRTKLIADLKEQAEREYHLGVAASSAKLSEAKARRRQRLEGWAEEQSRADWPRGKNGEGKQGARKQPSAQALSALRSRYLEQAVKEAAHTLINRLVILRILEAGGLSQPAVLTGGEKSPGYQEFQEYAAALCSDPEDDTKGYARLLQLLFDELAVPLPGVFGKVGLTSLFPIPAATLREVVEALNSPALESAWNDDTTLGWVYQFWNDPEREALDDKVANRGKIEPHEVASKTQLFTERYMAEWLLQNTLGQQWLEICEGHNWRPEFEDVRERLEAGRAKWVADRDSGAIEPTSRMAIHSPLEERWKFFVQRPSTAPGERATRESLREIKLLDPACGSGHFLVIAFDLLHPLYAEEARHRGEHWSDEQVAKWIVEDNLHGIDIDPRAIQIAAAAVWLKAKAFAPQSRISRLNLVAPTFRLSGLSSDDPALLQLQQRLKAEVGIPESLTQSLVRALNGVDHLGTLLRFDSTIRDALEEYETKNFGLSAPAAQTVLFEEEPKEKIQLTLAEATSSVLNQLGRFLDAHESGTDLGLRLEGQQLAAGVRFIQIAQEGKYDIVVGNPPYQGIGKLQETSYYVKHYPACKADLLAGFYVRGIELCRNGGYCAYITTSNWMFLSAYETFREQMTNHGLSLLADFGKSAFTTGGTLISTCAAIYVASTALTGTIAMRPHAPEEVVRDAGQPYRTWAALLGQRGRFEFNVAKLSGIEGTPLVYWWDEAFLDEYVKAPKLGEVAPGRAAQSTGNNTRFTRLPHELETVRIPLLPSKPGWAHRWLPFVNGAGGFVWVEPLREMIRWSARGLELKQLKSHLTGREAFVLASEVFFLGSGASFSMIGSSFSARAHRFASVLGDKGSAVYPVCAGETVCQMNSAVARMALQSLNPTVSFQVGDVNRLPLFAVQCAEKIVDRLNTAFTQHESHREPSVEFKNPGPSPWRYAQAWAQLAVDRPKGDPLPPYEEELDPPDPTAFVSFAIGVALGRFGENGEGILDLSLDSSKAPAQPPPSDSPTDPEVPNIAPSPLPIGQAILPEGILFVSAAAHVADSFPHPATASIEQAWSEHGAAITGGKKTTLNEWLRKDCFAYHKGLYENRPIAFPLSSEKKSFVAWVSIHRWADNTLQALLASHLHPAREKLQGEINDLNSARASSDKKQQARAEKQYAKSQKLLEELEQFIASVTQCAEKGAPLTDSKCFAREVDAPFRMDLDDGVMINSAALWPLLVPQWKEPKKWWKELCTAAGRKDYDWAHLAARYFPTRVATKCQQDPSLGVAHGCFWRYHPAKAYAWELRLQDEIAPEFTIDEGAKVGDGTVVGDGTEYGARGASDRLRARFVDEHPEQVEEIQAKEQQRRERNRKKAAKEAAAASDGGKLELRS